MRVVGIAIITALLSLLPTACAIQPGDPTPDPSQRPNELVGISAGEQPGVNARPQGLTRAVINQNGPAADSPNPSPWTNGGAGDPQPGNVDGNGSGSGGNTDNPNPSPWANPSDPHWGGIGTTGAKGGTGG